MSLTERVAGSVADPATDDAFDPHAELADLLAGAGLSPADAGGTIAFAGADPVVPSTLRLGGAAGIALVAKSVAMAKLWRLRGGDGQDIGVDLRVTPHRLCPFYDRRWELINGFPTMSTSIPNPSFGFGFYRTADDRWVMPLNPYPKIKTAAQILLDVPDDQQRVAAAISKWSGRDLEAAAAEAGVVMPMLRSTGELLAEPHYRDVLADLPLIEITKIGDSEPIPLSAGVSDPLTGVRALGMGHVIAGAGTGRALALHGADVLNLWRPNEFESELTYLTANVGVRSAMVDPYSADGRARIASLLADADVFYANRRPGYLGKIGLSAEQAAALRPGIVHASISLNGPSGPWSDRVGFDQSAGSLVGMMTMEGDGETPSLSPIVVVNDYIVSWLVATGIAEALARRASEGGSYRVHVSLTRAALWILSMGVFDRDYAIETAGSSEAHRYLDPETFSADTPLGRYQGITEQVLMSATPGSYRFPLLPRGAAEPAWFK
ncbi:MAG TPA: CoA transferase [Pseudonocardiaceae bacterium]|jgi:crotonobetainyl-CoA:carnitine CoA-transferase CaiB-like acyl-CoA transferase